MRIEGSEGCEFSRTEVALICLAVPCSLGCNGLDVVVTGHRKHGAGDDIVPIHALNHVIDFMPV